MDEDAESQGTGRLPSPAHGLLLPAHGLPLRPALPPAVDDVQYAHYDELAQLARKMEGHREEYRKLHFGSPAASQPAFVARNVQPPNASLDDQPPPVWSSPYGSVNRIPTPANRASFAKTQKTTPGLQPMDKADALQGRQEHEHRLGYPENEKKLYLPAPVPSLMYLGQASPVPEVVDPPSRKLVILDLNGTVLHRPSRKQPKRFIPRPSLQPFIAYLFDNFSVMVWSSARPENVTALVEAGLGDYGKGLVACWGRDKFGLHPKHYNRNVQCYKDLNKVWTSDAVQRCAFGARWDQRNTILIDDTPLKASAQPFNLLEIPEFKGTDEGRTTPNVLAQVAGYLQILKMQDDVSRFIHKQPFRANGDWEVTWYQLGYES